MGEGSKRKLRWFERRVVRKEDQAQSYPKIIALLDENISLRILFFVAAIFAVGTLLISGFSVAIPSELRVFLDTYLLSNILSDSLILGALSLLAARLVVPVIIIGVLSIGKWTKSQPIRNAFRSIYVYSWRNKFNAWVYPIIVVVVAFSIFLVHSFGLVQGVVYIFLYLLLVIVGGFVLILGDFLGYFIARKEGVLNTKIERIRGEPIDAWLAIITFGAFITVSTFCLGYGVALKRMAELVMVETASGQKPAAIIGITSQGIIVKWVEASGRGASDFAFLPLDYAVYSLQGD